MGFSLVPGLSISEVLDENETNHSVIKKPPQGFPCKTVLATYSITIQIFVFISTYSLLSK